MKFFKNSIMMFLLSSVSITSAMNFPHLDHSPHLERGKPGRESFGTVLEEQQLLSVDLNLWLDHALAFSLEDGDESNLDENTPVKEGLLKYRDTLLSDLDTYELFSKERVQVLTSLGVIFTRMGDLQEGIDYLSRAQHILHRHEGALSPDQLPFVYAKALLYERKGEFVQAEHLFRFAIKINERLYGPDSPEALTAMNVAAGWLRDHGEIRSSIHLFYEVMKRQKAQSNGDSPEMIPTMRGMAISYLLDQQAEVDRGLSLHKRIANIVQDHSDQLSLKFQVELMTGLGDWYLILGRQRQAWEAYEQAWAISRTDDNELEFWDEYFAQPKLIFAGPNLTLDVMGYSVVGKEVYYDFEFDLDNQGRPRMIKAQDTNLHTTTRSKAIELLRLGRYRPSIIDGQAIGFKGVQFRRVYPTDPPDDFGKVKIGGYLGIAPRY